jgi:hypothetical protein
MMHDSMTHEELQALVGRALVEPSFCAALLNGQRDACLAEFSLTAEEHDAASAIAADDLQDYAKQLDGWITTRRQRPAIRPFATPYPTRLAAAA